MKLEDAIKHSKEKAIQLAYCDAQCALEHEQLAEWLEELQTLRKQKASVKEHQLLGKYLGELKMLREKIWETERKKNLINL